jgi:hypothetical protein
MFLLNPSLGNKFIKTVTLSKAQKEILKAVDRILVIFIKYYYSPCSYEARGNGRIISTQPILLRTETPKIRKKKSKSPYQHRLKRPAHDRKGRLQAVSGPDPHRRGFQTIPGFLLLTLISGSVFVRKENSNMPLHRA